jgi:hypothetical protein
LSLLKALKNNQLKLFIFIRSMPVKKWSQEYHFKKQGVSENPKE